MRVRLTVTCHKGSCDEGVKNVSNPPGTFVCDAQHVAARRLQQAPACEWRHADATPDVFVDSPTARTLPCAACAGVAAGGAYRIHA